jgi:hypothetical protein
MAGFWPTLWTVIWYVGLGVFSVLSALIIVFGGHDLVALLASLRERHRQAQAAAAAEAETALPPPPLSP